tara:strand:+ start:597 stop:770 length:174 start_codon:yes stop_codon:yes gene_type:complete
MNKDKINMMLGIMVLPIAMPKILYSYFKDRYDMNRNLALCRSLPNLKEYLYSDYKRN